MSGRVRTIAIAVLALTAVVVVGVLVFGGGDDAESAAKTTAPKPGAGPTTTTTPTVPPPPEPVLEPVVAGASTTVPRGARKACGSGPGSAACRVTRTLRPAARPKPDPDIPTLEALSPAGYGNPDLKDAADPDVLVDGQTYFVFTTSTNLNVPVHVIPGAAVGPDSAAPGLRATAPTTTTTTTTTTAPVPTTPVDPRTPPGQVGSSGVGSVPSIPTPAITATARAEQPAPVPAPPTEAMPTPPPWAAGRKVWAPTVVRVGDRWVMFFAADRPSPPDPRNPQCLGRAEATSPAGPYRPDAGPFFCGLFDTLGALDPSVFRDTDGSLTLLAALGGTETNLWAIPLTPEATAAGPPTALLTRSGWETWFLENPSMIFDGEYYLLAYSAGKWQEPGYSTGLARCRTPRGPCRKNPSGPWLASAGGVTGTGGFSFFNGVDGSLFAAHHGYLAGQEGEVGRRDTYLQAVDLRKESIRLR